MSAAVNGSWVTFRSVCSTRVSGRRNSICADTCCSATNSDGAFDQLLSLGSRWRQDCFAELASCFDLWWHSIKRVLEQVAYGSRQYLTIGKREESVTIGLVVHDFGKLDVDSAV